MVVGSLNADFVVTVGRHPRPGETVTGSSFDRFAGGKGANQAYGAARLVNGEANTTVSMIGQVGADAHGRWLIDHLASGGVDVSGVTIDPSVSTGIAAITLDSAGQNSIVVVPGANGTFGPEVLARHEGRLREADVVLAQLEIPIETVAFAARVARGVGATMILDPAPARPLPDSLLSDCEYLTPNETELDVPSASRADAAALARRWLARGARNVLVKLGSAGALLLTAHGELFIPALQVEAVDTTAAGDAFNAGFAVALAEGAEATTAAGFAAATAAVSVTRRGAQPSMPTRKEVAVLQQQPSATTGARPRPARPR